MGGAGRGPARRAAAVNGAAAAEQDRHGAALAARTLACRYPAWDVRPVRVRGGWSVEAVPDRDDGRACVVIGTAAEVEAAIRGA